MPTSKSSPSRRLELGITLFGILGLALFLAFYDRVFPSASIDLDLSRSEITQRAQAYLEDQGYDLQGYTSALSFDHDWWGSVYMQRTLGIPETNRRVRAERLPIWYWRARWFRPLEKEEFSVYLSPDGRVVAFFHSIPEDAPGAKLHQDEARILAEEYLAQDRGWALQDWESIASSSEERPGGRVDHYFSWRRWDFDVGESELRLTVNVQGQTVDSYNYWLKVPEAFQRRFAEQRNRAWFFDNLSTTVAYVGFGLAAFTAYLIAAWRGVIPWHAGLMPALTVAAVGGLAGLNQLSLFKNWYPTTEDYTLFWLERLFNMLYWVGYEAAMIVILWVGGQRLSKRVWPRQNKILPEGQDRWSVLARSGWRGVMLGGLMAGYLILFYLAATRLFGGWEPMDIPDTDLFATPVPFLAPLANGLLPAMSEELMFRLVGISLLLALFRHRNKGRQGNRWLALLVPGALWGFAHLTYVREPFYLRGIELTIAAVFLEGLFFLKFDLTTTIVAHFTYNAGLTALPLLRSGEPYFLASGILIVAAMLAPVVPGVIRGALRRLRGEKRKAITPYITPALRGDLSGLSSLPVSGLEWRALVDDPAAYLFCLKVDGEIVGVVAGRIAQQAEGEVLAIYVAPAWRRGYWGSQLVDALSARMREGGALSVQATVETGDRVSVAFWASQGWRPAVKVFYHSFIPSRPHRLRDLLRPWRKGSLAGVETQTLGSTETTLRS